MNDDDKATDEVAESTTETANDDIGKADETVSTTSGAEETTLSEDTEVDTTDSTTDETTLEDKPVPYSRFKEVVEERNKLRTDKGVPQVQDPLPVPTTDTPAQLEQVKSQLKALGFITKEEQQAELSRRDEDMQVESQLSALGGKYDGKDGKPKFDREKVLEFAINHQTGDLEMAYEALNKKALYDWYAKEAVQGKTSLRTETSDGSGSAQAGTTDDDLKDAVAKGDKKALGAYLKRRVRVAQKK